MAVFAFGIGFVAFDSSDSASLAAFAGLAMAYFGGAGGLGLGWGSGVVHCSSKEGQGIL